MSVGEFNLRIVSLLLQAAEELSEEDLERFLNGCTTIVSSVIADRWERHPDRPEGWSA